MSFADSPAPRLTGTQWLICVIAAIGFAFDIYELLMMPLIARPALAALLNVNELSDSGNREILKWTGYIMWGSAVSGGIFGLLGGYLTDRLGRRRVLTWSILLYAFSAAAAGFATTAPMLLVLRCTTFIGVCVEFVAAVAWLSEMFPNHRQREAALGYTQAFSSIGGLLVTGAYFLCVTYSTQLPEWMAIYGKFEPWRYTLISGLLPAIPLIIIRPFLPESPAWQSKRDAGTLKRASIFELFQPALLRTTLVTALLFACCYAVAFGALQLTPQIVPGLVPEPQLGVLRTKLDEQLKAEPQDSEAIKELEGNIRTIRQRQQSVVSRVQGYQEFGGLLGRFALAFLAVRIVSRRGLLRIFQVPALIIIPALYWFAASGNLGEHSLTVLQWGIGVAGFLIVAQFSFWGNYLPRVYPVHLRGTGEGFAANVGGRMVGTAANPMATTLAPIMAVSMDVKGPTGIAYAAAIVAAAACLIGLIGSFWLPEPQAEGDDH